MTDFVARLAAPGPFSVTPYQPGKSLAELSREYGIKNAVKLASNENPLGASPLAIAALVDGVDELAGYPESAGYTLREKLAWNYQLGSEQFVLGNGSNEILELIARAFLTASTSAVMSAHCFTVYPIVTRSAGARVIEVPATAWGHDLPAMAAAIQSDTRVVFIANPNNPTGTTVSELELANFLKQLPEHLVVVLDEAYFEYVTKTDYPDGLEWLAPYPNLIVLRTFSKIYGLAGLRIGFGMADPHIIDLLNRIRQPFNINSLALVAAEAALDDTDHLRRSRQVNNRGMAALSAGFRRLGLGYIPSAANFITVDLRQPAMPIYTAMLRRGVIVRPLANYQMPNHLRITIGLEEENERCLKALSEALDDPG